MVEQPGAAEAAVASAVVARVLVLDDDEHILALLADILDDAGYEVTGALDGATAIGAIRRQRPDVILLDLMMPVLDGWGFFDLYRQLPGPHAPVIVITAATPDAWDARDAADGKADGKVEAVVPKPFSIDHLLSLVDAHTGRPAP